PKISVLMAINKKTPYLDKAINSILNQTFKEFEFIIIANGCDDDLYYLLNAYSRKDSRIILHRTELGGFAFALNYGLNLATTEYIARMDGDDLCTIDRLQKQYDIIKNNKSLSLLGTACNFIGPNDEEILSKNFKILTDNGAIRRALPYRNPIIHASIICRKDVLLSAGGYRYGHMSEDHELFIRLARDKNVIFMNTIEPLYSYRRHHMQVTDLSKSKESYAQISAFLFSEFLLTHNYKYIIGILRVHPYIRKMHNFFKRKFHNAK
ncbi:glycosyltransferase, partial [Salmonella enterica]|nr:glycosyltransferase [Salmonella enterica]